MFENLSSLKKVRAKALGLTRFDNWIIIDSNQPKEVVASNLRTYLT
jgi:thymidylate kinase